MSYDWVEIKCRRKKDGLHDSGYRFIQVTGVRRRKAGKLVKKPLHQWSDHVLFNGPVNIDFEPDGTMRIMPSAGGPLVPDVENLFCSSALFYFQEGKKAAQFILASNRIHFDIAKQVNAPPVSPSDTPRDEKIDAQGKPESAPDPSHRDTKGTPL